jgi:hypothetical protein
VLEIISIEFFVDNINGFGLITLLGKLKVHYRIERIVYPSYLIVPAPMKSICDNVIYYFLL